MEKETLPEICIKEKNILPESLRNAQIVDEIISEVYNGWPGRTGEVRVSDCLRFIAKRIPQYSEAMGKTDLEVLTIYAKKRRVNYTNWFQDSYLPDLSDVLIFDTVESFKEKFPSGKYVCPACGGISTDYQECNSGKKIKKKVCDWKVYGLFGDLGKGIKVIIKDKYEEFPKPLSMFRPIELPNPERSVATEDQSGNKKLTTKKLS